VTSVAFGLGAKGRGLLATYRLDGTLEVWDPDTGRPVWALPTPAVGAMAFGVGAGGRRLLIAAGHDGTVQMWDSDTGEHHMTLRRRGGNSLNSYALASDGTSIAIGSDEGVAVIDIS